MARVLPSLVGLTVLLTGGLVHGWWTDRWLRSEELADAVRRIDRLPVAVGQWTSEPDPQEDEALALAGAVGHYCRTFVDRQTGDQVGVILLVGRGARMVVHRPEHCYQAAGYVLRGLPVQVDLQPTGEPTSQFLTGLFARDDEDGPTQLRIFWSFGADGVWEAPTNPRLRYAGRKVLYKLHLFHTRSGPADGPLRNDPSVRLLADLLPVLNRTLFTSGSE